MHFCINYLVSNIVENLRPLELLSEIFDPIPEFLWKISDPQEVTRPPFGVFEQSVIYAKINVDDVLW